MKKEVIVRAIFCAAMALLLAIGTVAPAAAAENAGLENAILKAKGIIAVPAELTEFSYDIYDNQGTPTYNLRWNDKEYRSSIFAAFTGDSLTSFYRSGPEQRSGALAVVSRARALESARAFLAKCDAAMAAKMKEDAQGSGTRGSLGGSYYFNFVLEENGLPADFVSASVSVSNATGEVLTYNWQNLGQKYEYPAVGKVITPQKAMEAYLSYGGIKLEYMSWYDWESKEFKVFPAYVANDRSLAVEAATGAKVVQGGGGYGTPTSVANAEARAAGDTGEAGLTEAEIAGLEKLAGLISKEAAQEAVAKHFPESAALKLSNARLGAAYDDKDQYYWALRFEAPAAEGKTGAGASASVDAATGEVTAWSRYGERGSTANKLSRADAYKIATDAAGRLAPAKFAQTVPGEDEKALLADKIIAPEPVYGYYYSFYRQVSGTPFRTDYITVAVDPASGAITSYSCGWHGKAKFPDLKGAITPAEAAAIYADKAGFGMKYVLAEGGGRAAAIGEVGSGAADAAVSAPAAAGAAGGTAASASSGGASTSASAPVAVRPPVAPAPGAQGNALQPLVAYHWLGAFDFWVEPFTGKLIDTTGKERADRTPPSYDDISGHWAEDVISILLDSGYYTEGGSFEPNAPMRQEKFFRFLYATPKSDMTSAEFYKMLDKEGALPKEEANPEQELSRYDAAKSVARYLKMQALAERPEIFRDPFKDAAPDAYKGYVAVAKALEVMKGDTAGNFNGGKTLTNAEAAMVVYNLLRVGAGG
ncbi:MAG: S-layer homology domain-containing protein [Clostridiales Family XIII bacterium]|jgi:hypothetical protein|nr:S-layer homology domain-containing protein [Clostridiales Family XIII bacterium]